METLYILYSFCLLYQRTQALLAVSSTQTRHNEENEGLTHAQRHRVGICAFVLSVCNRYT